jgi:hypothetical protein
MTTVTAPVSQPQALLTFNPTARLDELWAEREARIAAERTRDLLPLDGATRRASLDVVTDADGGMGHVNGVFFIVNVEGETLAVGLDDVEDFVEHYGLPATHEHAAQVWERICDEPVAEEAIEQAIADWIEECRENDFNEPDEPDCMADWGGRDY